jgi:hypothetical protein
MRMDAFRKGTGKRSQARHRLALLVMRHIGRGERDPICLAYPAVLDFLR